MSEVSKEPLLGRTPAELKLVVGELGLPSYTAKQLAEWIYKKRCGSFDTMTNLSKQARQLLSERYEVEMGIPLDVQTSTDGTKKYLYRAGTQLVEAAYIPSRDRATLCVSTEAGCKMDCLFCQTGKQGFQKKLTAGEIVNQIFSLPEFDTLTNVVYMGMGEPFDNYENVMSSLDILTSEWGLAWSPTRITVSTSGLVPEMKRFLAESKCHLAVSMHSPFHDERLSVMPIEKAYPIKEVIHALRQYDWSGQRRVSFEYIVFKDFNDTPRHVTEICKLLGSLNCRVNLIRFHAIPGIKLKSPTDSDMVRFRDMLNDRGIIATIRASRGQDIDAACGLLSTKGKQQADLRQ